jgi:hypothetical protein
MEKNFSNSPLIFNQNGGDTFVAGYMIPETFGKITTYNGLQDENNPQKGGNIELVSNLFKGLAVPAGLFLIQQNYGDKSNKKPYQIIKQNVIEDDLYEKLFNMVSNNDKKKFIKKTRINKNKHYNKKTRKNK